MRQITLDEVVSLLKENDDFLILTHRYPDGDTLGSSYALCHILRKMGKKANVLIDGNLPKLMSYLADDYEELSFEPSYIISVDVAAPALLGENMTQYKDKINLCIDHHGSNTMDAENIYVDANAAAASEIIFEILELCDVDIDEDIACALYTGISTDTGCFCYSNTTERTHIYAAKLMSHCDWKKINRKNFQTKTRSKLKMERMVYDTMEFYAGGKCSIIYITRSMIKMLNAGDDEMEGLASIPSQVEGVLMGITMREKPDGIFKISVRTNEGINASDFCKQFGGGGHPGAAGCTIKGDLASVKYRLIKACEETL